MEVLIKFNYFNLLIYYVLLYFDIYLCYLFDKLGNIPNNIQSQSSNNYHSAIFNHLKTFYISPQKINPKHHKKMKIVYELEEFQKNFQFFRLLIFPTMNVLNPSRICEISSVYLTIQENNDNSINNERNASNSAISSIKSPTMKISQQTNQKINPFKSLFRRNLQIYVGNNLTSELTAIYSDNRIDFDEKIDQKTIENLINNWHYSYKNATTTITLQKQQQKQKQILRWNTFEHHYLEIEWISRNINILQKFNDENEFERIDIRKKSHEIQRHIPYTIVSIQNLKRRLIQVIFVFNFLIFCFC